MSLKVASGNYVGDGVIGRHVTTGLDHASFPTFIIVKRSNGTTVGAIKFPSMAGTISAVFSAVSPNTNWIRSLDGNGFFVGSDVSVNQLGESYEWVALMATNSEFAYGTYVGDGTDNRDIAIALGGNTPSVVMVKEDGGSALHWRTEDYIGDDSQQLNGVAAEADRIQSFGVNKFTIGTNAEINQNGNTFYYVAFRDIAGYFETGKYDGNGTDDRFVGVGFLPGFVLLVSRGTVNDPARFRTANGVGDTGSLGVSGVGSGFAANKIQGFGGTSFQIGADDQVNAAGGTTSYRWIAAADQPDAVFGGRMMMNDSA